MSWETLSKDDALLLGQKWRNDGKSDADIRGHLVIKGLTYPEADEILSELSAYTAQDASDAGSLGEMAQENLKHEDTARGIAFNLWKQGKSPVQIRINLADRGFSSDEIEKVLSSLGIAARKSVSSLSNYGSLGKNNYGQARANTSRGISQVAIGAVIMLLGCTVTFFTYQAAANSPTGGRFIIATGAIIGGGILILRGLMKIENFNFKFSPQVIAGLVIMAISIAITFFSYQAAANSPGGGTYYITYGPIIFGAWMVFRGLTKNN